MARGEQLLSEMPESDYWVHLEYRVTRALAAMESKVLRALWCDGFVPENYLLNVVEPCITGTAWICNGPQQSSWNFRLDLQNPVNGKNDIPWANLLPADDVTDWLAVSVDGREIRINPFEAVARAESAPPNSS